MSKGVGWGAGLGWAGLRLRMLVVRVRMGTCPRTHKPYPLLSPLSSLLSPPSLHPRSTHPSQVRALLADMSAAGGEGDGGGPEEERVHRGEYLGEVYRE